MMDITDNIYGLWTVLEEVERDKNNNRMWLVVCECGDSHVRRQSNLVNGHTQGCFRCINASRRTYERGKPFSVTVMNCLGRCTKKNNPRYKDYGGRGISICPEWIDAPGEFRLYLVELWYETVGTHSLKRYGQHDLTLDRIDNESHYEPGNLRFTTMAEQVYNSRRYK